MAFYGCYKLKNINISNLYTDNVTSFSDLFGYCYSLERIDLRNIDTCSAESTSSMFFGCKKLKAIDLSHFNTRNLKTADSMFRDCESLTSITFGKMFDTSKLISTYKMFEGCKNLEVADLRYFKTNELITIASMFNECNSLRYLNMQSALFEKLNIANLCFHNTRLSKLILNKNVRIIEQFYYEIPVGITEMVGE